MKMMNSLILSIATIFCVCGLIACSAGGNSGPTYPNPISGITGLFSKNNLNISNRESTTTSTSFTLVGDGTESSVEQLVNFVLTDANGSLVESSVLSVTTSQQSIVPGNCLLTSNSYYNTCSLFVNTTSATPTGVYVLTPTVIESTPNESLNSLFIHVTNLPTPVSSNGVLDITPQIATLSTAKIQGNSNYVYYIDVSLDNSFDLMSTVNVTLTNSLQSLAFIANSGCPALTVSNSYCVIAVIPGQTNISNGSINLIASALGYNSVMAAFTLTPNAAN